MNRTDAYRLEALLALAAAFPQPLRVAEVARRRRIPEAFLARIFAGLSRAGVIATVRGRGGGARLARRPDEIVLEALLPTSGPPGVGGAAVHHVVRALTEARTLVLRSFTLAALLDVERALAAPPDFAI
jgi:Rrf2 family protein